MNKLLATSKLKQGGVTSIFVVVFATLLLSVITLSFAYLMNREAQRSSDDELSQSAYDSAMAGVEDAKRVIMRAQAGDAAAQAAIDGRTCDTVAQAGVAGEPGQEVLIQSTEEVGSSLNQAYTCVKINLNSADYVSSINTMQSAMVPLRGVDNVHSIRIDWHATGTNPINSPCGYPNEDQIDLCQLGAWGDSDSTPALLRTQLITPQGGEINYSDLDEADGGNTVFLYPKPDPSPGSPVASLDMDQWRRYVAETSPVTGSGATEPHPVPSCTTDSSLAESCSIILKLPGQILANSTISFLRLTAIYKSTDFRVTLLDESGEPIEFRGVQPVVDSTGRANDLFRRVEARLSLESQVAYPGFAVDVAGDICKDFYVTNSGSGQYGTNGCTP